jgi:hypothetical protein
MTTQNVTASDLIEALQLAQKVRPGRPEIGYDHPPTKTEITNATLAELSQGLLHLGQAVLKLYEAQEHSAGMTKKFAKKAEARKAALQRSEPEIQTKPTRKSKKSTKGWTDEKRQRVAIRMKAYWQGRKAQLSKH